MINKSKEPTNDDVENARIIFTMSAASNNNTTTTEDNTSKNLLREIECLFTASQEEDNALPLPADEDSFFGICDSLNLAKYGSLKVDDDDDDHSFQGEVISSEHNNNNMEEEEKSR